MYLHISVLEVGKVTWDMGMQAELVQVQVYTLLTLTGTLLTGTVSCYKEDTNLSFFLKPLPEAPTGT